MPWKGSAVVDSILIQSYNGMVQLLHSWSMNKWMAYIPDWFFTCHIQLGETVNTLRPRQDGCHFPDDIIKCIFLKENAWILLKISLNFVPKGSINNIPSSDDGLAPIRRQDIFWTDDGPVNRCICASLGLNELKDIRNFYPTPTLAYLSTPANRHRM